MPPAPPDSSFPTDIPPLPLDIVRSVSAAEARLDVALADYLPGIGLRGRRRLWSWCRISVNGRQRPPGHIVRGGDCIRITPDAARQSTGDLSRETSPAGQRPDPPDMPGGIDLVARTRDFAALYKPEGLHSAHIAGGTARSVEDLLPSLWPELWSRRTADALLPDGVPAIPPSCRLLTRLDQATSGLLLLALNDKAEARFRREEKLGQVHKTYYALVRGALAAPLDLRARLRTDNRERTLVQGADDPDPARHTRAVPLEPVLLPEAGNAKTTLVRVHMQRGARHQIRAHLAHAGYPLAGEWLYAPELPGMTRLYLHHAAVHFPGFSAACPPPWALPLLCLSRTMP